MSGLPEPPPLFQRVLGVLTTAVVCQTHDRQPLLLNPACICYREHCMMPPPGLGRICLLRQNKPLWPTPAPLQTRTLLLSVCACDMHAAFQMHKNPIRWGIYQLCLFVKSFWMKRGYRHDKVSIHGWAMH